MHRGKVDPGVSELPRGNELSRVHVNRPLEGDFIIKITKVRFQHNVSQLYAKAIAINCIRWSGPKAIAYNSRFRIFQQELGATLESFRSQNEYDLKQCLLIIKYN